MKEYSSSTRSCSWSGVELAGVLVGLLPQPFQDVPRRAEAVGVGRAHLGTIRVAAVEFGLHQGDDVDAVDRDVLEQAVQVHVDQERAADRGAGEVDVAEPGAGQVDLVEPGAGQVLAGEVSHPASLHRGRHLSWRPWAC